MTGLLHPHLVDRLARDHHADLLREARAATLRRQARRSRQRAGPLRTRVGWMLVEVGLRLAVPTA
ncbi:hypothetical protein [Pseudonocardia oroxyli]|uniref:Uncharacterized protein n=1 Tax=Pseudonocardia oroxyli TaxID=366584 RepID=A0A1G7DHQ6_PSEOR|nr:hypothetical protein [Pseudonocardia oroxyli]SDE50616.1 hypothetical protein SAMN05216377_10127 [Pseudonocardia oroxyli]